MSDTPEPVPTLMKRRWWVTITVVLFVAVVLIWLVRQPDGEPPTEEEPAGESSSPGALTLPDSFTVADQEWNLDDSAEAQERLAENLGEGFEGRTIAEDGTPGGAIYVLAGDAADSTVQLVASLASDEAYATTPPSDAVVATLEGNAATEIGVKDIDDGAVGCGKLTLQLQDGTQVQDWVCAAALGATVVNLLLPDPDAPGEEVDDFATAFYEAAAA